MKTITIPMEEYETMKADSKKLKKLEKIDFDLIRQFKESFEDLKKGRFKRLA